MAIVLVASALRIGLAVVRDPFFDELVSVWFSHKPLAEHWAFLVEDSGPPLYYAMARLARLMGATTVDELRTISLIAALLTVGLVVNGQRVALVAAAMLAVFPPHVFFSTEARAYALAAFFVGAAVLGLDRWRRNNETRWLWLGTASLLLAGYTHWYGVLVLPLPLVFGLSSRNRRLTIAGLGASAMAGLLFIPGFWLASQQPTESIAWMRLDSTADRLGLVAGSFLQLGFAAPYPAVFMTPPPVALRILSLVLVAPVALLGLWKNADARIFAIATLLPLLLVGAFALAGPLVYFPMRFESVLSVPFVLWLGHSWTAVRYGLARMWLAAVLILGLLVSAGAIAEHYRRAPDSYRQAAEFARHVVDPRTPIVAGGYAYLEVISQIGPEWRASVTAFPQRQATHPGWKETIPAEELRQDLEGLPETFVWIGTLHSPEVQVIAERYRMEQLFSSGPVVVAMAERRA